jgi:signal transduction histidine kinase
VQAVYNGVEEPLYDRLFLFCWEYRNMAIVFTVFCAIAAILLLIFLLCSAGHRSGTDEVIANSLDRIPLDIFGAGMAAVCFILIAAANESSYYSFSGPIIEAAVIGVWIIVFSLLLLLCLMTLATRLKLGTAITNTVCCRVIRWLWKGIRQIGGAARMIIRGIPLIGKTLLGVAVVSVVEIWAILTSSYYPRQLLIAWFIEKLIVVPVILLAAVVMRELQKGGREMAEGHLEYRVDTSHMFGDFKRHGENLNSISDGINKAVNEKMKSERFKTELITNVSHDIKTPLTSIINYVDLIRKEEPENETIAEYIEVLDRQSKRLKKLIEDLVEASKASTGNVNAQMAPTGVGVLLTQAAGEYDSRMNEKHLELILNQPEEDAVILADGRLLWRVFDNLLSNICKYAQSGTRVYLSLERVCGRAIVTFRNISAYQLNLSEEELLERFTRGDSSRHTEGSGLGLSIAKSLTDLQHGEMRIYTDGDLFKVVLTFDEIGKVTPESAAR